MCPVAKVGNILLLLSLLPPFFVSFLGWGFLHTADIWHTETPMEEMLLLAAVGLQLTAHQKSVTWYKAHLHPYFGAVLSRHSFNICKQNVHKILSKACWSFYINYVANVHT